MEGGPRELQDRQRRLRGALGLGLVGAAPARKGALPTPEIGEVELQPVERHATRDPLAVARLAQREIGGDARDAREDHGVIGVGDHHVPDLDEVARL